MVIIGAGGLAKELVLSLEENEISDVAFFDNVSIPQKDMVFTKYPILHNNEEVLSFWASKNQYQFHIGIGSPMLRRKMYLQFEALGGKLVSLISTRSVIGNNDTIIEEGVTIMQQAIISNTARVGKGVLIYYNALITHDVVIGEFCEISPGANLLGGCHIGACTQVGAYAIILPKIKIGKNVIVAAGSVVLKDVPDDCLVAGIPATIKKFRKGANNNL
jgi:sugar O-acyltransferase (sialic acid O-acetyltransferase NeuD family)